MEKTIEQEMADFAKTVVTKIDGRDVTQGELSDAFKRVQNREHWKNPVDATIPIANDLEREVIGYAVTFFTGSVARFQRVGSTRQIYRVTADGYYAAIGA